MVTGVWRSFLHKSNHTKEAWQHINDVVTVYVKRACKALAWKAAHAKQTTNVCSNKRTHEAAKRDGSAHVACAQLAVCILSPRLECAAQRDGQRVCIATGHIGGIVHGVQHARRREVAYNARHSDAWQVHHVRVIRARASKVGAQATIGRLAAGEKGTVAHQHCSVVLTSLDGHRTNLGAARRPVGAVLCQCPLHVQSQVGTMNAKVQVKTTNYLHRHLNCQVPTLQCRLHTRRASLCTTRDGGRTMAPGRQWARGTC